MGWKFNSGGMLPTFTGNFTVTGNLAVGGQFLAANGSAALPSYSFAAASTTGFFVDGNGRTHYSSATSDVIIFGTTTVLRSTGGLSWSSGAPDVSTTDVNLLRDAANVLALRNGTTAQEFRLYNTYTDGSNYERLSIAWSGGNCDIRTQNAGTGSNQALQIGTNGTGSLRLVSNGSSRFELGTAGHLLATTDNTYDIGASGANRPRSIYVGTNVTVGGQVLAAAGTVGAPGLSFSADPTNGMYRVGTNNWGFAAGGTAVMGFDSVSVKLSSAAPLVWSSAADISSSGDVILRRDAANVLALRNSTTAQQFNVYKTYTDASNYERMSFGYDGALGTYAIRAQQAGTGVARGIGIDAAVAEQIYFSQNGTFRWKIDVSGYLAAMANLNFWNGTSALATTATAGFLGVNSCAGTPTGVPASIPTGQIPIVYDTTANKIWFYNGSWRGILVV